MRVQSLASLSGLRIRSCCKLGIGHSCSSDSIPGWELPYATGVAVQRKRKKKKERKKKNLLAWELQDWLIQQLNNIIKDSDSFHCSVTLMVLALTSDWSFLWHKLRTEVPGIRHGVQRKKSLSLPFVSLGSKDSSSGNPPERFPHISWSELGPIAISMSITDKGNETLMTELNQSRLFLDRG